MENLKLEDVPRLVGEMHEMLSKATRFMDENENPRHEEDSWLDLAELCNYDPRKPAKATVYGWVSHGQIPYHKRGKKLYFKKSEIDAWLASGRRLTLSEREASVSSLMANRKGGK